MNEMLAADELFRIFVLQQQQLAMIHLGKLVHPATGELARDLDAARFSIELLAMMEAKTKGNLGADEERMLGQVLTTLRLNFVEESGRPGPSAGSSEATEGAPAGATEGAAANATQGAAEDASESATDVADGGRAEGATEDKSGKPAENP